MLADVFDAVAAHASLAGVTSELGAEFDDELAVPPRMVWMPTSDSFAPGKRVNTPGVVTKEPKAIGTRSAGVRIRVWGEDSAVTKTPKGDIRATERLVERLLVAIHEAAWGSYVVRNLDWQGDGAALVQQGRCCDVHVSFDVPIAKDTSATATLAVINSAGMDGGFTFPSGDVAASPSP